MHKKKLVCLFGTNNPIFNVTSSETLNVYRKYECFITLQVYNVSDGDVSYYFLHLVFGHKYGIGAAIS